MYKWIPMSHIYDNYDNSHDVFFTIIKILHVFICIMHTRIQKIYFLIYLYCFNADEIATCFIFRIFKRTVLLFLFLYTDKWNRNTIHSETMLRKPKTLERWHLRQIIQTSALKGETRHESWQGCTINVRNTWVKF